MTSNIFLNFRNQDVSRRKIGTKFYVCFSISVLICITFFSVGRFLTTNVYLDRLSVRAKILDIPTTESILRALVSTKDLAVTDSIDFFGVRIGSTSRICASAASVDSMNRDVSPHPCWITAARNRTKPLVHGPTPIMVRSWMTHKAFESMSMLLFLPSHAGNGESLDVQIMGMHIERCKKDQENKIIWKELDVILSLPQGPINLCESYHNPSIVVDDDEMQFFMYVHGQNCEFGEEKPRLGQATLVFVSQDGVSWDSLEHNKMEMSPYLLLHEFNLSVLVCSQTDGYFYGVAMSQEDDDRYAALYRSKSLRGPFEKGPVLANGLRDVDLNIVGETIYVFFTLIGDMPERILLGSVDISSGSDRWMQWKLLPGPTLLEPNYVYEHGNATVLPSSSGHSRTKAQELRHPRFLPLKRANDTSLSGIVFYTTQGEQGVAASRLTVDLESLHSSSIIKYRKQANISPLILKSSSLASVNTTQEDFKNTPVLVTGTGRSGTTTLCTIFQQLGLRISHDNNLDCGPYPGSDGAVSWYDAFKISRRTYTNVLHLIRNPIKQINSRARKCPTLPFYNKTIKSYEKLVVNAWKNPCYKFALKHWVRRNSFVENYASWRERIEDVTSTPLSIWNLCMAGHFGRRCPSLARIHAEIETAPHDLNSGFKSATSASKAQLHHQKKKQLRNNKKKLLHHNERQLLQGNKIELSWESLLQFVGPENKKYVEIAQEMGRRYGYEFEGERVDYFCDFSTTDTKGQGKYWDCFISNSSLHNIG